MPRAALRRGPSRFLPVRGTSSLTGLLLAGLLLGGCGGEPEPFADDPVADPLTDEQAALNDLLDGGGAVPALPPCGQDPPGLDGPRPDGLQLPPGSVVQLVEPGDPLVTVHGYVELTPVAVRRYYERRDGLTVFNVEDEGVESEVLVGRGRTRTYVKALATCETGSSLLAVVGPAGAPGVPVPTGSPAAR